jgi:hypothetical protein
MLASRLRCGPTDMPTPSPVRVIVVDDPLGQFGTVETWGLAQHGLPEIEAREVRQFLLPHAVGLVRRLADYLLAGEGVIRSGQSVRFGPGSAVRLEAVPSESGREVATLALVDASELRSVEDVPCDHRVADARPGEVP